MAAGAFLRSKARHLLCRGSLKLVALGVQAEKRDSLLLNIPRKALCFMFIIIPLACCLLKFLQRTPGCLDPAMLI